MGYWLKLYTDILGDYKYHKLSEKAKLGIYELMLVVKENESDKLTGILPPIEEIAFCTRRDESEWEEIIKELEGIDFIATDGDNRIIKNYVKRQSKIPDTIRSKENRKRKNKPEEQPDNESKQSCHKPVTSRDGDREIDTDRLQITDKHTEREKKDATFSTFISEFITAVRVQFTNNDQSETVKDLVEDYGQDIVLQAATWYGNKNPRNMGHALKSIETALSKGWDLGKKTPLTPSQILEQMINESEKTEVINGN